MLENVVIAADRKKEHGFETAGEVARLLERNGLHSRILGIGEEIPKDYAELVMVLGGDGSVIQTAKQLAGTGIPILGVNFGTLGFLTEVERPKISMAIEKIFEGKYKLENRMALSCDIIQKNEVRNVGPVINEFVVCKRDFGHMVTMSVFVDGDLVDKYVADGILISTPTGSTAYNLSAQGPILTPDMEALIITPICPHSLNKKSLVVSSTATLRLTIDRTKADYSDEAAIRGDGILLGEAATGDEFIIKKADETFVMMHIGEVTFYEKMRGKLN